MICSFTSYGYIAWPVRIYTVRIYCSCMPCIVATRALNIILACTFHSVPCSVCTRDESKPIFDLEQNKNSATNRTKHDSTQPICYYTNMAKHRITRDYKKKCSYNYVKKKKLLLCSNKKIDRRYSNKIDLCWVNLDFNKEILLCVFRV